MSRIIFNSSDGDAEVLGVERHNMALVVSDVSFAFLHARSAVDALKAVLPATAYPKCRDEHQFPDSLRTFLAHGDDPHFVIGGQKIAAFEAALNTIIVAGSDPLRLMARLHGQCEIHCWVEAANRAWLAEMIADGMSAGLLRSSLRGHSLGWGELANFLLRDSQVPVVCSYSVCDSFPSRHLLGWDEDREAEWDDKLTAQDRWGLCMEHLRMNHPLLELRPNNWPSYRFGQGLSYFDVLQKAEEALPARADAGGEQQPSAQAPSP